MTYTQDGGDFGFWSSSLVTIVAYRATCRAFHVCSSVYLSAILLSFPTRGPEDKESTLNPSSIIVR